MRLLQCRQHRYIWKTWGSAECTGGWDNRFWRSQPSAMGDARVWFAQIGLCILLIGCIGRAQSPKFFTVHPD
ncbi:uncharacterized protein MYCFIDRAFT_172104 [Pseudocercospora fijiensis CIRAD86]|uniref:Uncharacterized protein n=1 Tax=Pseudocercospora fijiensis (strain CIRAD86) TaxID=383855 RepID=M3BAS2_PSEFD|nr:uncharacterized protein MYCFIDRAFT_172104 [Pseudocercospora fijiensis CIRAD86]EME86328.1 hypothetical protein MYCFIDRAFT_172104 [Pseudocercospora fijiensis CIRAD86]